MTTEDRYHRYLCSSCKKRIAVYKRKTSGEYLCRLCLFRSLVKQVRRAIHYYRMIHRSSSVLYIIRPEAVAEAVAGIQIYRGATKNFNLNYYVMCVNGITDCNGVEGFISSDVHKIVVVEAKYKPENAIDLIKFLESLAVRLAKKLGIRFVVTPLFRDELSILSIIGVLTTSRTAFSEGLPIKISNDVIITRPFFYVISADISMIKVLEGIDILPRFELKCDEFMQKAKKLLHSSPELMYSSIKSIELLQTYVFGSPNRCRYCGAFSSNEVCDICKKFHHYIDAIA